MSEKPAKPVEIFYSYAHEDEELRDELEKHLSTLKRQGVITGWHDRRIGAGKEWAGEIDTHLNTAHVILLLISSDFLASDYCYDVEMKRAMERHEAGEARVIPVILRPVDWKGTPFSKLQALPKDAAPVTEWPNRDTAFLDVAQGIRAAVEELLHAAVKRERKEKPTGQVVVEGEGDQVAVIVQGENVRDKELAYLDGLLACYEYWRDHYTPLAGIAEVRAAVKDGPRLDLPMPFIPPEFEKLVEHGYGERVEVKRVQVSDLREAVAEHRRIVLLGEPGSGKTTTLWRLAYDYAIAARTDERAPLPVLVRLGGYTDDGPFDAYLAHYLGPLAAYLETYRASRRLILLLDGLNEMPRAGYDGRVGRIRDVLNRQPDDVVVVTCRALDYVVKLEGLQKVEVSPLDEERIRTFLHNYLGETAGERLFWAMAGDEVRELWDTWQQAGGMWAEFWTAEKMPGNVHSKTTMAQDRLWERLQREPPSLLALGRNPYLLLMTAQVYAGAGGELPANRAKLFPAFVDTLLGREKKRSPERWIEAKVQKDGLAALAYAMQMERGRGTTVEREWAVARLCQAVPSYDAERLLYLATSATLLDADEATVRFYHQLLQEYFAAREMGQRVEAGEALDRYWLPKRWWEPSGWEETAILLAGVKPDASALLEDLTTVNPVVAARCLVEGGAQASEMAQRGVILALVSSFDNERMAPGARAQAGQLLARLGDPRPGVGLREDGLPDVVWCEVPAGPFVMGDYHRQHQVDLSAYSISKYPVTNAQYAAFIQDGGYHNEDWWKEAIAAHHWSQAGFNVAYDDEPRIGPNTFGGAFDLPNHPVMGVSWYESVAFCRWLTERLRETGEIGPDQEVTLPTEAQWEKAARGGDSRIFPWGDEFDPAKCNVSETGIEMTSAVGIFSAGASPYGALDQSGNVWEWCRTKWRDSYREPADESLEGHSSRVLRGGAFNNYGSNGSCVYRLRGDPPSARGYGWGFRVVGSPSFPSGL